MSIIVRSNTRIHKLLNNIYRVSSWYLDSHEISEYHEISELHQYSMSYYLRFHNVSNNVLLLYGIKLKKNISKLFSLKIYFLIPTFKLKILLQLTSLVFLYYFYLNIFNFL